MSGNLEATYQSVSGDYNASVHGSGHASVNIFNYANPSPSYLTPDAIKEAQQYLLQMSVDTVPAVSTLPFGSYMPLSPNPLFVGRNNDLKALARQLKEGATIIVGYQGVCATVGIGIGGVGKTQLATEFVHRYGQYFKGGVFWLNFSDGNAVPAEIVKCSSIIDLNAYTNFHNLTLESQLHLMRMVWQNPIPRLLIFDNCEDEQLLDQWRPTTGGCSILVTSRRQVWSSELGVRIQSIGVLKRVKSIELLQKYRPDLSSIDLEPIADELSDLPLALSLAGGFLRRYRHSQLGKADAYLEHLQKVVVLAHPSLQGKGTHISPTRHELSVERTFAISYEQLNTDDTLDQQVISLLAHAARLCPGEPIPRDLLKMALKLSDLTTSVEVPEELQIEDIFDRLAELGLFEASTDDGKVRLHRLVALFIRERTEVAHPNAQQVVEEVILLIANQINKSGYPLQMIDIEAHLRNAAKVAQQNKNEVAILLNEALGFHLYNIGVYDEALQYLEFASTTGQEVLGSKDSSVLSIINKLACVYVSAGEYSKAEALLDHILSICKDIQASDQIIAASVSNLAYAYKNQGKYEQAQQLYETALCLCEKAADSNDLLTVRVLNNIASLSHDQGQYEQAGKFYQRALSICENIPEQISPQEIALLLSNFAYLCDCRGAYKEAEPLYHCAHVA